jgi:hypothetical protein
VEQGLVIEESAQGQEGLDTQAWCRRITHAAARERIEHPRGNGQFQAILELDDQTIRSLTS